MSKKLFFFICMFIATQINSMEQNKPTEDKLTEQKNLLFPVGGLTDTNKVWQLCREQCYVYSKFSKFCGCDDVSNKIMNFLIALENNVVWCTPQEELFQRLLNCCITWNNIEEPWGLPDKVEMTHDNTYYVGEMNGSICIHDVATKRLVDTLVHSNSFALFKNKNLLLVHPNLVDQGVRDLYIYDIEKKKKYMLIPDCGSLKQARISPDERSVAIGSNHGFGQDKVILFDISNLDLNKIEHKLYEHHNAGQVAFSSDGTMLASVSFHNDPVVIRAYP